MRLKCNINTDFFHLFAMILSLYSTSVSSEMIPLYYTFNIGNLSQGLVLKAPYFWAYFNNLAVLKIPLTAHVGPKIA